MSQPSPDAYEQGRGMDAHNEVMREVRARNDRTYDPTEPTRVWLDEDNTPDGVRQSLTIILNTGGCRWARAGGCTMCGYVAESVDGGSVAHEDLLTQVEACLEHEGAVADVVEFVGTRGVSGLERLATGVYLVLHKGTGEDEDLARELCDIKPHVSEAGAREAVARGREFLSGSGVPS